MDEDKKICSKCGKKKRLTDFFKTKDGERHDMCKACLTMHIDNFKPDTYLWILKQFDMPYIEDLWNKLRNDSLVKNPRTFGPGSVIGTYIRMMNMSQYKELCYADTDTINEKNAREKEAARALQEQNMRANNDHLQHLLDEGEITEAEFNTLSISEEDIQEEQRTIHVPIAENNPLASVDESTIKKELGEEDLKYLLLKWGTLYKPSELVKMEELYCKYEAENELSPDREDALKKICKTSLKMDQALDVGDVQAYKNLSVVYDQLRRSSKFTEAQNKEEQTREIDSIGELVAFVEREGGAIPLYEDPIKYPKDKVDFTIKDMQNYVNRLVRDELGLGDLIESFIEKTEKQKTETVEDIMRDSFKSPEDDMLTEEESIEFQNFYLAELEEESKKLAEEFKGGEE